MRGQVVQSTGNFYDVMLADDSIVVCRLKGKFRLDNKKQTNPIAVGDYVMIEKDEQNNYSINEILPRKNYIVRSDIHKKEYKHVIASNVDQTVIIASLRQPRTAFGFIDRVLLTSEVYGIPAKVIFNKHDLYKEKDDALLQELLFSYNEAGYESFSTSVLNKENIEQLHQVFENNTSLIIGLSGVGKSSLVNSIFPHLNLRVGAISAYSEKGLHTTTFAHMYRINQNSFIIDTPGIKEFGLVDIDAYEVGHYFPEIRKEMNNCKFNDCMHINEAGCAIKDLLEEGKFSPTRYTSYITFVEEIKAAKKW
jgi:ribosome biogenesis GTPase / thiamine phosphate phosphatase